MSRIRALFAALAGAALLFGCASAPEVRTAPGSAAADLFRLDGKVSWRAPDRRGRASLIWNEAPQRTRLVISGPFGSGTAVLKEDTNGASLEFGDRVTHDVDAGRLLERELGLRLPVREVRDWIRGRPGSKGAVVIARDQDGRIVELEEAGWAVRFDRYSIVDGIQLPGRVVMEQGAYALRFVATRWRLGSAEFPDGA